MTRKLKDWRVGYPPLAKTLHLPSTVVIYMYMYITCTLLSVHVHSYYLVFCDGLLSWW